MPCDLSGAPCSQYETLQASICTHYKAMPGANHSDSGEKAKSIVLAAESQDLVAKAFATATPYTPAGMPSWYKIFPDLDLSFIRVPEEQALRVASLPLIEQLYAKKSSSWRGRGTVSIHSSGPHSERMSLNLRC